MSKISSNNLSDLNKIELNRKVLNVISRIKEDTLQKKYLFDVANNFYGLNASDDFYKTAQTILKVSKRDRDTINIAKSFVYLAEYHKGFALHDSAYFYFLKAEKYYAKVKDFPNLADVYVRKADLQSMENDFFGSEKSALDALAILREYPNPKKSYEAFNLIGISSNELNSHQKAIEYFDKALKVTEELDAENKIYFKAISLNNIGSTYQNLKNFDRAIRFFNRALEDTSIRSLYPDLYATILDNIAYSRFKLNIAEGLPNLFYSSLEIRSRLKLTSKVVLSKIHLSEYYAMNRDTLKAIQFSKEALALARIERFPTDVLASLKQLSIVDSGSSSQYSEEYIRLNDSLQQTERTIKDRFYRIQYETDEISIEKDQLEEQNRNLLYFFVGTLMIGLLLFVIRTQRARNRELLLKQAQQKANEDIYSLMITQQNRIEESRIREKKRIAQELHDGVLGRLFGARLNLDSLNRVDGDEAVGKRNSYLAELKNIEQDIREISHDLNREKYVLINNFVAILNNLLEEQRNSFTADVQDSVDEKIQWESLSNTLKINLYRIIQESLQNINKYAGANNIILSIKKLGDNLVLNVSDDGVGFAVGAKKKGIGLQNMLSRTNDLNGVFDIRSRKGKGTTIIVTFPIENKH